jgi:hypothetical protein
MSERTDRPRGTAARRVALTSLLVASGIGVVGVVPALAAGGSPAPAAFHSDHDRDLGWGHGRLFRDRGDFRYVWFKVCEGTATGATTSTTTAGGTTTAGTTAGVTTTDTVAPDAIAAAVEGAAVDTATPTDTTTPTDTATPIDTATPTDTVTTETTKTATTGAEDDPDAEKYPTFVVVPMPKDEAKTIRKLDERPCYDLATGAPQVTDTATTTTDAVPADTTPLVETTTETPVTTATG